MSNFKNREDVIEWVKYDKLYRLLLKRKDEPITPQIKELFEALANGQGFRIDGFWWDYDELLDVFYSGVMHANNDFTTNIIVNILGEEGLTDYDE